MKINVVGNLIGTDGYSSHTKGLTNALFKLNPDIKLDVPLPQNWMQQVNDEELKMIKTPNRIPDVTIGIVTPPFGRIVLGDNTKKYIQYVVWEGDSIPEYWIEYLMDKRINQIWVPSLHTKDAICNTIGLDKCPKCKEWWIDYGDGCHNCCYKPTHPIYNKIKIVPHGHDPKIFHSQRKKDKDDCSNDTLSGDTTQIQGKTKKDEHMPVEKDNHADNFDNEVNKK